MVYHNKEVNGLEFDFCVLLNKAAILIIEVKGWRDACEIDIDDALEKVVYRQSNGISEEYEYPKNQSRMYRMALVNSVREMLKFSPKTFDMFITPIFTESRDRLDFSGNDVLPVTPRAREQASSVIAVNKYINDL